MKTKLTKTTISSGNTDFPKEIGNLRDFLREELPRFGFPLEGNYGLVDTMMISLIKVLMVRKKKK